MYAAILIQPLKPASAARPGLTSALLASGAPGFFLAMSVFPRGAQLGRGHVQQIQHIESPPGLAATDAIGISSGESRRTSLPHLIQKSARSARKAAANNRKFPWKLPPSSADSASSSSAGSPPPRDTGNLVHIRFFHALQKLPRVTPKVTPHIALAFRVHRVKRQRRFPDPLTPVTTVSALCGISTLTFLRLCTRAPRMRKTSCCSRMGGMVSFVAKGKPRQRAFRTLPKLQSIRLR